MTLFDYHLIGVDRLYDDRPTASGIIPLNAAAYRVEKELNRYERKLLQGVIVAIPAGYSQKNYMPLDPGIPNYKTFVGHDIIQEKVNRGYEWGNGKYYHPGGEDKFRWLTMDDYGMLIDAKIGEKCYFHPEVTEKENYLESLDNLMIYKAAVDQLICAVGETIRPQGGYVLVEPVMETEADRTSATGLIIKAEVEARLLEGKVAYAGKESELKTGDLILYQVDANWEVEIEGRRLYAMKEDEVWVKMEEYFQIVDCNGVEFPNHYSGRLRTHREAKLIVDSLNRNGEFRPYKMISK